MARVITGPLETPSGDPVVAALLRFVTARNSYSADGSTPIYSEHDVRVDALGQFRFSCNFGEYRVLLQPYQQSHWLTIGSVKVTAGGTVPLGELIEFTDSDLDTTYPDVATRTWVTATYSAGTASSLAITDLDIGYAQARQLIRVDNGGAYLTPLPRRALEYYLAQSPQHKSSRTII